MTNCAGCGIEATTKRDSYDLCETCAQRLDAYQGKRQHRTARLYGAAAKAQRRGQAKWDESNRMASIIPMGQPIQIGHYSEGRDRRYRARIHNKTRQALSEWKKQEYYEQRAQASEKNRAISSDNPLVLVELRKKLASKERYQKYMVAFNKLMRSLKKKGLTDAEMIPHLVALDVDGLKCSEGRAAQLLEPDFLRRVGFADYETKNNGAEIRRIKQRIEQEEKKLKKQAAPSFVTEEQHGDVRLVRNTETNRLQLFFPGKPSAEIIKALKSRGFHWSRGEGAWQRMMSNQAEWQAESIIDLYHPELAKPKYECAVCFRTAEQEEGKPLYTVAELDAEYLAQDHLYWLKRKSDGALCEKCFYAHGDAMALRKEFKAAAVKAIEEHTAAESMTPAEMGETKFMAGTDSMAALILGPSMAFSDVIPFPIGMSMSQRDRRMLRP
jgi:hypothetical protein